MPTVRRVGRFLALNSCLAVQRTSLLCPQRRSRIFDYCLQSVRGSQIFTYLRHPHGVRLGVDCLCLSGKCRIALWELVRAPDSRSNPKSVSFTRPGQVLEREFRRPSFLHHTPHCSQRDWIPRPVHRCVACERCRQSTAPAAGLHRLVERAARNRRVPRLARPRRFDIIASVLSHWLARAS